MSQHLNHRDWRRLVCALLCAYFGSKIGWVFTSNKAIRTSNKTSCRDEQIFLSVYGLCRPPHRNSIYIYELINAQSTRNAQDARKTKRRLFSSSTRSYFIIAFRSVYLNRFKSQPATLFEFHEYFRIENGLRIRNAERNPRHWRLRTAAHQQTSDKAVYLWTRLLFFVWLYFFHDFDCFLLMFVNFLSDYKYQ